MEIISNENTSYKVAEVLLKTGAVKVNVGLPFTYASGIKSPIYCDNRLLIGIVEARNRIVHYLLESIKECEFDVIVGTATAGIPWASFLAEKLQMPMSYVRGEKKEHGTGKQLEGSDVRGLNILLVEDLITTGKSVLKVVDVLKSEGAKNISIMSIFNYEYSIAKENLTFAGVKNVISLSSISYLLKQAESNKSLLAEEVKVALKWKEDPQNWYETYYKI